MCHQGAFSGEGHRRDKHVHASDGLPASLQVGADTSRENKITINIDSETIDYFKGLSEKTGMPYQTLINLYLTDCAKNKKEPNLTWA